QAQDLLGRKIVRDGALTLSALLDEIDSAAARLPADHPKLAQFRTGLISSIARLREVTATTVTTAAQDTDLVGSVAYHMLQWLGVVIGAWQWSQYAAVAIEREESDPVARATVDTAAF